jgi:hypothetical protein
VSGLAPSTPYRFCIIKDADGRDKPDRDRVGKFRRRTASPARPS